MYVARCAMRFALMDCNNFYASCEKAFAPALRTRPVVVLSNNDGCVIARSAEAKALGVPMGAPLFKCREQLARQGVAVFSSNYALYGDMSARVMAPAGELCPRMEVYSIDEAFLELDAPGPGQAEDQPVDRAENQAENWARQVRDAVLRATGITVSVGIGPTKTLAKAANKLAKKLPQTDGILTMPQDAPGREPLLARLEAADIWGVGRRHAKRLEAMGVRTALEFMRLPREGVRAMMTVTGLHTWLELHGTPCIALGAAPDARRTVMCSRSFGSPVTSLADLREAVSTYAAQAARRLREQRGLASLAVVYVQAYAPGGGTLPGESLQTVLLPATSVTARLIRPCLDLLERLFRPGLRYKKAGVMLGGIESEDCCRPSLLDPPDERGKSLMRALDAVNGKWGRDTLYPASCGVARPWRMRQDMRSPRYTTSWEELPEARA